MIEQVAWLDREFTFDQPTGIFPILLERLRGTPGRAKGLVVDVSEDMLATRPVNKWSAKEHLGHLIDLEPLDEQRLREFLSRTEVLSAADIENRATENADHRRVPIGKIIARLTSGRERLINRLEALTEKEVAIIAIHPRLQKPMRLLDWVYFLAEHDDHHLALARAVIVALKNQQFAKEG